MADASQLAELEAEVETEEMCEKGLVPNAPWEYKLYQHTKSRMLHLMAEEHINWFRCGRMAGDKQETSRAKLSRWDTQCAYVARKQQAKHWGRA